MGISRRPLAVPLRGAAARSSSGVWMASSRRASCASSIVAACCADSSSRRCAASSCASVSLTVSEISGRNCATGTGRFSDCVETGAEAGCRRETCHEIIIAASDSAETPAMPSQIKLSCTGTAGDNDIAGVAATMALVTGAAKTAAAGLVVGATALETAPAASAGALAVKLVSATALVVATDRFSARSTRPPRRNIKPKQEMRFARFTKEMIFARRARSRRPTTSRATR